MTDHILPGKPPVPLTLRRSARARRISLRVSQLDGRVTLTLPARVPQDEALAFARSREDWIRRHLATRPDDVEVAEGAAILIEGRPRRIVPAAGRRIVLDDAALHVPASGSVARQVQAFLRLRARDKLVAASDHYAGLLGRPYARVTLRDTRSRWGSCSSNGGLMYSWRLILAPPDVLRYVAAHEVAHLAEMNHSAAFWSLVDRLHGPYDAPRSWLRENGAQLHRYRF